MGRRNNVNAKKCHSGHFKKVAGKKEERECFTLPRFSVGLKTGKKGFFRIEEFPRGSRASDSAEAGTCAYAGMRPSAK